MYDNVTRSVYDNVDGDSVDYDCDYDESVEEIGSMDLSLSSVNDTS